MNRYTYDEWEDDDGTMVGCMRSQPCEDGEFVLYEDAHTIEVDRDIKAANLDTLRKLVLAIEVDANDDYDRFSVRDAMDFARGLPE
jgi:hypothetical protein